MAIFVMDGSTYVAAILLVTGPNPRDVLAMAMRPVEGGRWQIRIRFRYHMELLDSADEKRVTDMRAPEGATEEDAIKTLRDIGNVLVDTGFNTELTMLTPRTADPMAITAALQASPHAHTTGVTAPGPTDTN